MTGTYDPRSIVFDKPVPVSDLNVGYAMTYSPPADTRWCTGHHALASTRATYA